MFTSYFAARHPNPVSIALYPPRGWDVARRYQILAPTTAILQQWKAKLINEEQYTTLYYKQVLSPLDPSVIYNELVSTYGAGCALVCYEKPGDFCHRHIVAQWFKDELGILVEEWKKVQPPSQDFLLDRS